MSIAQPSHSHSINLFSLVHGYNRPPDGDDDDEEDIDATGPSTQDKIVDSLRASRRERARMLKLKAHEDGARHAAKQQGHLPVPLLAR